MPKQTFFNLPDEKREVILEAAVEEFSEFTLQEASIANIIKRAKIPRGSFYQYFEDKDDLFIYLVETGGENCFQRLIQELKAQEGDIFEACESWFKENMTRLEDAKVRKLWKNVFLSMNEMMQDRVTPYSRKHPFAENVKSLVNYVDVTKFRIADEEELNYFLKMLKGIVFGAMANYLKGKAEKEKCLKAYEFQMDVIRRGISRD